MNDYGWGLFKKGLKRRGKEVRRMRVMTCLAVFFLAFILLLQDNVNAFQLQLNYKRCGRWAVETDGRELDNGALYNEPTKVLVGGEVLRKYPKGDESDVVEKVNKDENGEEEIIYKPIRDENGDYLPLESDITVAYLGGLRSTNTYIGVMPADFAERNNIELYEGRLPENRGEIAMELQVLQKLGLDYTIGNTIEFYVAEPFTMPETTTYDPDTDSTIPTPESAYFVKLHLKTFTLVGTVKRYTFSWGTVYNVPNAFITPDDYNALDMNKSERLFYEFKEEFVNTEIWGFAEAAFSSLGDTGEEGEALDPESGVCCNRATYYKTFWGNSTVYKAVTALLVLISAAIIAYLMASYLGKRRKFFLGMKEIGATTGEVFRMAAYEYVISVLPAAFITLVCTYLAATMLSFVLSLALSLPFTFIFRLRTLLLILAAVAVTLALALAAALAIFAGRGLHDKKAAISKPAAKGLRFRAKRKNGKRYAGLLESLRRDRRNHPIKNIAIIAVTVLACCVVIYALTKVATGWMAYRYWKLLPDITGEFPPGGSGTVTCLFDTEPHYDRHARRVTTEKVRVAFGSSFLSMDEVIKETDLEPLKDVAGIKSIKLGTFDCTHYLAWEGWQDDAFIRYGADKALHNPNLSKTYKLIYEGERYENALGEAGKALFRLFCFGDGEAIWKKAKKYLDKDVMDLNAFKNGEQIFIVVDETCGISIADYDYGENEDHTAPTNVLSEYPLGIKPGDTVYIESIDYRNARYKVPVTVAGVLNKSELSLEIEDSVGYYEDSPMSLINIVGSPELARRVMVADGKEYGANFVEIKLTSIGIKERSSNDVIKLMSSSRMQFSDNLELAENEKSYDVEYTLTYGPFALALIILWLFVMRTAAREERITLAPKVTELTKLGADEALLKKQKRVDAAKQSLWALLAIPTYLVTVGGRCLLKTWGEFKAGHGPVNYLGTAKANLMAWLHSSLFGQTLAYSGNCTLQVTVIIALLFCLALYFINRRLRERDEIKTNDTTERNR